MNKQLTTKGDYQLLKVFLDRYYEWYVPKYPTTPKVSPSQFLENIEKTSLADAKRGLSMALNDTAEGTANWTPDELVAADARFLAAGTVTLSEVRRRYSKKYLQILKRGVIRSETDYYLLKGILDGGSIEAGATESVQIQKLINEFETKIMQGTTK